MLSVGPLMIFLQGTRLTVEERGWLRHPAVGGVIFFSRNYNDKKQLSELVSEINAIAPDLILATDHEGGRVQRLRRGFTRLPSAHRLGQWFDQEPERALSLAYKSGRLAATELSEAGIHTGFSPVLDLFGGSDVIGDRALHAEPAAVVQLAGEFIEGLHDGGVTPVGKHFPGHGTVAGDTHATVVEDRRRYAELQSRDLKVFRDLIAAKVLLAVMAAHVIYPRVDTLPAGLSTRWLRQILREELDFEGIVFSDDLAMRGVQNIGGGASAKRMLEAGCDMVLVCNDRQLLQSTLDELSDAEIEHYASAMGQRWEHRLRRFAWVSGKKDRANWDADAVREELNDLAAWSARREGRGTAD